MADVFMQVDAQDLLKDTHILFLGDSNIRAQYKDLAWLLNHNTIIPNKPLRAKLEPSYLGDTLIEGSKLHHGRDYRESRLYHDKNIKSRLEFIFMTRCYNSIVQNLLIEFKRKSRPVPDVIVINSCLWDVNRWGPNGVPEYKDNMVKLMRLMKHCLPKECLVIWTTALPTAPHIRGGLMIKQIEFMEPLIRFEVMEANTFAREVVVNHGFDVLDSHYYTRMQMHRRAKDGIHYLPIPVRFMTNLLLTHIALSWGRNLPNNTKSLLLDNAMMMERKLPEQLDVKIPTSGLFSKINLVSPEVPKATGLSITFNQESGRRWCKLFQNETLEPLVSVKSDIGSKVKSVVQIPQSNPEPHASAGPCRRKKNKKRRKANQPYQTIQHHNPYPRFYQPYQSYVPNSGGYCNNNPNSRGNFQYTNFTFGNAYNY